VKIKVSKKRTLQVKRKTKCENVCVLKKCDVRMELGSVTANLLGSGILVWSK
jgi:hypothetical protein